MFPITHLFVSRGYMVIVIEIELNKSINPVLECTVVVEVLYYSHGCMD